MNKGKRMQARVMKPILLIAVVALTLGAAGCAPVLGSGSNAGEPAVPSAPLSVVIGDGALAPQTLIPDMTSAVDHYEITLTRSSTDPNAGSYNTLSSGSVASAGYTFSLVPLGDWDIQVIGYDLSNQPITEGFAGPVTVVDPGPAGATVTMAPLQSASGTLTLSYNFPPGKVDQVLLTLDDGVAPTNPTMTVDTTLGTADYTGTHASGFYELKAEFQLTGQTRAVTIESVHIYDYQNTPHSLTVSSTELGAPPPAPSMFSAKEIAPGSVEITWGDTSAYETGYVVERSTNSFATVDGSFTTDANAEQFLMTGLLPGVFYTIRVFGVNDFGNSSYLSGDVTTAAEPVVMTTTPTDGTAGFPVTGLLVVDFSTPMDQTISADAVYVAQGPAIVPTTATWLSSTQLQIAPMLGTWPRAYAPYTLVVGSGIQSLDGGGAASAVTIGFTTAGPVGELDPTFAVAGQLTIEEVFVPSVPYLDTANAMTIGGNGIVYVVGTSYEEYLLNNGAYVFAVDPFTGGGAFGNPLVYTAVSSTNTEDMYGKSITVDGRGDLVIGTDFTSSALGYEQATFLSRGAAGATRTIFGGGTIGMEYSNTAMTSKTTSIEYSSYSDAIFASVSMDTGSTLEASVIKYAYSGPDAADLDGTFGTNGMATFTRSLTDKIHDIAFGTVMGGVYAVGETGGGGQDLWVLNIDPVTGTLNTGFNSTGELIIDHLGSNLNDVGNAILVDDATRIVVAGQADTGAGGRMAVWRFNADGTPDTSFGLSGVFIAGDLSGTPTVSGATSLAIDAAGNIVAGGFVDGDTSSRSAIWRLTDTGALDTSFNPSATSTAYPGGMIFDPGGTTSVEDLRIHPFDQSIFAVGTINATDTDGYLVKIR